MNKFILSALALLFAGSAANATLTPSRQDIRLQKSVRSMAMGGVNPTTEVRRNGVVITRSCQAIYPTPCKVVRVQHLSAGQMDRIENLIDRARHGKKVAVQGIHCMAMPSEHQDFYADNGRVFLRAEAHPCGLPVYNNTRAAAKLVAILNDLHDRAFASDASDLDALDLDLNDRE